MTAVTLGRSRWGNATTNSGVRTGGAQAGPKHPAPHPQPAFLDQLSGDARAVLSARGRQLEVGAGREIFTAGEAATQGGLLLRGQARIYLSGADGRELTLRYAEAGSLIGFLSPQMAMVRVEAMTDCSVLAFEQDLLAIVVRQDPETALALVDEVGARLVAIVDLLSSRAFAPVERRLAAWIVELAEAQHVLPGQRLVVSVTQQALADDLGTGREVVNRIVRRLERDGLIEVERGVIVVAELESLRAISGGGAPRS
ncbi:MAG: Crp/Fnr family transcriptional regulator [Candidatus Limnocylindrales bacterium]